MKRSDVVALNYFFHLQLCDFKKHGVMRICGKNAHNVKVSESNH